MAFISTSSSEPPAALPGSDEHDEVLYQNERTLVFRRHLAEGSGSLICKQPTGPKAAARLRHERRILERLSEVKGVQHPSAVPVAANVIAFADGDFVSLAEAVRGQPFDLPALLALALQLTDILAAVHRAGVVHKDLSPANILLCGPERQPLLIDFDLATTFAEERPGFIQPQDIAGTLAYIAPEQTGRTGRAVDQRADLYSLGAVLYELATGRPPFDDKRSDPLQLIHDILAQAPAVPTELNLKIPPALSAILLRLLEKEADRRYQSAEGLRIDLLRLREMQARGQSDTFPLGEHDYPLRLSPPSRLIGREKEIGILQAAFDNALHGRGSGVLVSGAPGVGKTALINELRPLVTARRGWFIAGKFDQYRRDTSSNGCMLALHALVRLLLAEPEAELARHKTGILTALGSNAGLMASLLPELAGLLDVTPESIEVADPVLTERRMFLGTLDLLRAVASPTHPLVMVIDDLQWAPPVTFNFIDDLLQDDRLRGLLLVGAYRDSEVDVTHPLAAKRAHWERMETPPLSLRLNNLPPDDLATLLTEMLRLHAPQASQLAEAVGARTGGNPFDTVELINALRRDGVLTPGEAGWQWEAATIRRYVGQGEVIDLLAVRIARLPAAAGALLDIMACLGGDVSPALLAAASSVSAAELETQLTPALEDGLLVMEGSSNSVRFRHDRVQQAAYSRLDPAARSGLRLAVARRLTQHPEFAALAAGQYLAAADAVDDPLERRHIVDLFHAAATTARQASNYGLAESFLTAALTLLPEPQTAEDIALRMALLTGQHAALYCLGRLEEADQVYQSIERRTDDPLELVDAAGVQLGSLTNRGLLRQAVDLGLALLRRFGLAEIPADIGAAIKDRFTVLSHAVTEIDMSKEQGRPEASDPQILGQAKLLDKIIVPAFFCDPALNTWLDLECERLWVEQGPCADLLHGLGQLPVLLISRQDYPAAFAMKRRVLSLAEAYGYRSELLLARSDFSVAVDHWAEPLENTIGNQHRTVEALLQAGNLQYACYSYHGLLPATFDCAATLDSTMEDSDAGITLAEHTGNNDAALTLLIYRQLVHVLRGETHAPGSFTDASFDEEAYLAGASTNPTQRGFFRVYRALSAALVADAEGLAHHAAAAISIFTIYSTGYYVVALAHLLQGLALAQRIGSAAPEARGDLLAELDICRSWLAARAADAPMNFLHLVKWIDAERAWATADTLGAIAGFDSAMHEAASTQRPWHRALITERAGLCHLAQGLEHTGRSLLAEARRLYEAWGASAKVQNMTRRYDFLRGGSVQRRRTDRQGSSGSISVDSIDLLGIVRASQALSSETNFVRLRVRIDKLLRELTGATHIGGAIWHEDRHEWYVSPPMPDEGESNQTIPVEEAGQHGLLPLSVFNYVVRTREPLLVDDALRDDRFAQDAYFAGVECCSLLGVPVFNQGVLRLVLLLENRLGHGAFSAGRLEAVNLIATQLAISTDNALLYASLEHKVAERTQALEAANERLAALSTTDALTGLANRRHFNEVFEAKWRRLIKPQDSLAVAMIDIDQFKLYNDHYGHLGGDECLRKVAVVLKTSIRGDGDLVARYGGEEFVLVLPDTDLAAAQVIAERARAAVEALNEPHEKADHGIVTISGGIAAMVPTEQSHAEALIELADAALYRAKKNGRNQVVGRKADELAELDEPEVQVPVKPRAIHAGTIGVSTAQPLRILMIEDSAADAELMLRELKRGLEAVQFERVDTAETLKAALARQAWDIVICDYHLPGFGALPALALVRQHPDYLPFIIVSGVIREETAVEAMKIGVDDYVLKSNLARLVPAIRRELETNQARRRNALAEQSRQVAELQIRRLNRVLAVLSGVNALIVRVRDRDELYRESCRIAVEAGQFEDVLIAMIDPGSKQLGVVASSNIAAQHMGEIQEGLQALLISTASPEVRTIHDLFFVKRQALVVNDTERELPSSLKVSSRLTGTNALCALPLVIADQTVGVLVLRAREAGFFDAEELKLLTELAGDISFALDHLDKAEQLDYLAYYDQLTGLANATLFRERLAQHLRAANGRLSVALALLDVERFKSVNDALGRPAGDALLKQLAWRLATCVGSPAKVAHLGADHFALILPDVKDADQVARIIENEVRRCIDEPFLIADTDFKAAAKIGIALHPSDGTDADALFRNAEAALKKAKAGGEKYLFYAQHMTERVAERLSLENKLRRALEREEFVLHYQPKVALETMRITGVEALIRWNDPATGLVPPMQFIPLMEETGLILEVGDWALGQAVKDHKRWLALGLAAPRIAVNVSAIQLRQKDFVEGIQRILAEGPSPPGIDIEITESLIMDDVEGNIGKLEAIRDMGMLIAIDDFGTGYSSLAYLAKLPTGTVKIDRSFIITMLQNPNTMTLVSTIISLAHSLGLTVVAEGVDQEAQAQVLRSLHCDEMQGYLFSKPVPFEEILALLRAD